MVNIFYEKEKKMMSFMEFELQLFRRKYLLEIFYHIIRFIAFKQLQNVHKLINCKNIQSTQTLNDIKKSLDFYFWKIFFLSNTKSHSR